MFAIFPALLLLMFHAGVPVQAHSAQNNREARTHVVALVRRAVNNVSDQTQAAYCAICLSSSDTQDHLNRVLVTRRRVSIQAGAAPLPVRAHFTGLSRDGPIS